MLKRFFRMVSIGLNNGKSAGAVFGPSRRLSIRRSSRSVSDIEDSLTAIISTRFCCLLVEPVRATVSTRDGDIVAKAERRDPSSA